LASTDDSHRSDLNTPADVASVPPTPVEPASLAASVAHAAPRSRRHRAWAALRRLLGLPVREPLDAPTTLMPGPSGESARRWRARAALSGDWFWETDASHRIVWVSEDARRITRLGLDPHRLLGRTHAEVPEFLPPDGGWDALHARMSQHHRLRDVVFEVHRPGGRAPLWVAISARPRHAADGSFVGYEGVGHDVTEQQLALKRLRESEQRYAVMAGLSSDWYWETDAEHRYTSLGEAARERLGALAERAIGATAWDCFAPSLPAEQWARHRDDLDARRTFRGLEYRIDRGPGQRGLWVSISGSPRFDAQGRFLGYHGVGSDITLRKRAERLMVSRNTALEAQVRARTAELERANRDLDAFARQLAHELRTPIAHIQGLAELLLLRPEAQLDAEARRWVELQLRATRSMAQTVTALLDLARSASLPIERVRVDVSQLAHEVSRDVASGERRAPVRWHIQPGLTADAAPSLLRVVLANLLGNAAKFTRDVDAPVVALSAEDVGGVRVFTVTDNGAGFDEAKAATLFQPFVRLHGGEQFAGSGLGLSIVRRIVERHGGWVHASGHPGVGAQISFTLAPEPPDPNTTVVDPSGGSAAHDLARPAATA